MELITLLLTVLVVLAVVRLNLIGHAILVALRNQVESTRSLGWYIANRDSLIPQGMTTPLTTSLDTPDQLAHEWVEQWELLPDDLAERLLDKTFCCSLSSGTSLMYCMSCGHRADCSDLKGCTPRE